ncbi:hypothetical protein [Lacrimispora saccharolytica]|uniref:Uncharacterized protein n=1 Tax=Lacrimispora saccharolytica (strain ATCC 35040 / DSM 2544 / NRCC 2533 / WM1) TaxID=610130 RepID=D9R5F5_LACSW|nr:hypothetical protein [Lacrimispora saccharolytica]ADL03361.1 hypothetical protein Closa_0736 [[Clostridium] saccharolyticum WM1]QRV18481.1 hypothetical protein I6K70_13095 [Lacrimispora saccharolytica]
MISEADFIIYNTAKKRTKVCDNAETDAQTIVSLEKEVRYYRNIIEQMERVLVRNVENIMFLCDRRACDTCLKECKHTSDIKHAENFQLSMGGKRFIEKETKAYFKACQAAGPERNT